MQEEMRIGKSYQDIFNAGYQAALASQAQNDPLDTAGNRHPQMRYAGYKGQPLAMKNCTADEIAAYDEGVRASKRYESQAQQPTDLSKQLREYAADSGYSHNDYADTMLAAASEIERLTTSQAQQESKPVVWGYAWQCKSMGDWRIEKLGEGCIPPKDTLALYVIPPAPEGDKP